MKNLTNQDVNIEQFIAPSLNLDGENSTIGGGRKSAQLKNALNLHIEGFDSDGYWVTQEVSNTPCFLFPKGYTYKGHVKLDREQFVLFFVQEDGITSEIGIFDATKCGTSDVYTKWAESTCLGFEKADWIHGVWRYDKIANGRKVYINDGVNLDKILFIDKPHPTHQTFSTDDINCRYPINTTELDCEQLLCHQKIKYPCINISGNNTDGLLPNGRYQVAIAGSDGKINTTDYVISNDVVVYSDNNTNSIDISLEGVETEYDYIEVILIASLSTGQNAYSIGHYQAKESRLNHIDNIKVSTLTNKAPIDINQIILKRPYYLTSQFLVSYSNSLIKGDITTRPTLFYQHQANKIKSVWKTKLVKASLAHKYPQHMRDETYAYFIEWYYRDGEKSLAYHIPNNSIAYDNPDNFVEINNDDVTEEECQNSPRKFWELYCTAIKTETLNPSLENCDVADYETGEFGIYESELTYPIVPLKDSNNVDLPVYDNNGNLIFNNLLFGELTCKPIRLHKYPDNNVSKHYLEKTDCSETEYISVLGIEFSNIERPRDLEGNIIPDIVGYRILRADRSNNEGILSKGLFAHMWYDDVTSKAWYPTIGYGSVDLNPFLGKDYEGTNFFDPNGRDGDPIHFNEGFSEGRVKNMFTYISPETSYTAPRQGSNIKLYNTQVANITATINDVYKHPRHKIITPLWKLIIGGLGAATGVLNREGSKCIATTTISGESSTTGSTLSEGTSEGKLSNLNLTNASIGLINQDPSIPADITSNWNSTNTIQTTTNSSTPKIVSLKINKKSGLLSGSSTIKIVAILDKKYSQPTTITVTKVDNISLTPPIIFTFPADVIEIYKTETISDTSANYIEGNYSESQITQTSTPVVETQGLVTKYNSEQKTINDCNTLEKILNENPLFSVLNEVPLVGSAVKLLEKNFVNIIVGAEATRALHDATKALMSSRQYGVQIDSVGDYSYSINPKQPGDIHRVLRNISVLQPSRVLVGRDRINNEFRVGHVFIKTNKPLKTTTEDNGSQVDNFLQKIHDSDDKREFSCSDNIKGANHYGAIYNYNRQQYGRLYNNNLVPMGCINYGISEISKSPFLYQADTYITKFSTKNHFLLFEPTYIGQTTDYELDYKTLNSIAKPVYWMDTNPRKILQSFNPGEIVEDLFNGDSFLSEPYNFWRPSGFSLEALQINVEGLLPLAINAVYNFYVESSYINTFRQITEIDGFYPKVGYKEINRSDKWFVDNQYMYDQSLRVKELHDNNVVLYNQTDRINRDRFKVAYSEYNTNEDSYDRWNLFKPLSYFQIDKGFGYITGMIEFNKKLFLFFEDRVFVTSAESSLMSKTGEEIYLGIGDIFSRKMSPISTENTGLTGCLDRYSILASRHGLTWVDRKRKKIWMYSSGPEAISNKNTTMWFQNFIDDDLRESNDNNHLLHKESFITIYDNHYDKFYYTHRRKNDCSWTLSYKPGVGWISFHSFFPIDYMSLPNDFLSVTDKKDVAGIYLHNRFVPDGINTDKYQCYYGEKFPYYFTYVSTSSNNILQSLQIKHETITEYSYDEKKYHNNIFFNKFNAYSEYGNSGDLELIVKDLRDRSQQFLHYGNKCVVSHIEQNHWRLNNFKNFAICQPHHKLLCNGHTPETYNVCTLQNPRGIGNLRGDWFAITFINDKVFDKRFRSYISFELKYKIKN